MQQNSSWKADSLSAGQEIQRPLYSPEVHYRFNKSPPLAPILKQINSAHARIKYFLKSYCMVILPLCPKYYSRLLTKCTAHMRVAHVKP
jgi:hypothetical protein